MNLRKLPLLLLTVTAGLAFSEERKMVNGDPRVWLIRDDQAVSKAYYYRVQEMAGVEGLSSVVKTDSADSGKHVGAFLAKTTEWKTDRGKEQVTDMSVFDAATKQLLGQMTDTTSKAFVSTFLDKGDWIDKFYAVMIPSGYDSIYVRIDSRASGYFGVKKVIECRNVYLVYPNREPPPPPEEPKALKLLNRFLKP